MRSKDMALDYMARAIRCLEEAELAFSKEDYSGTVRRSQEALELASKAILRIAGIEYPREHDVGPVLDAVRDRLPNPVIENLDAIIKLSSELASLRGPAMYGYEREGIPAREAFKKDYAFEVFTEVERLVEIMRKALYEVL
ncbi:MAG: HEPN domain-containing protein [Nitrososphaeria archaeon]|nr:HEPN domain-containing protein [Nitrososphaeria archaeon]